MAKRKTTKASEVTEVAQVENGSVADSKDEVSSESVNETEVATESVKEEEKPEEKVELSETDKVNEEINEISDEAEEEVDSVNESVALDEATSEVTEEVEEEKKPNEKFFVFDKREARQFFLDPEHFLSVIFYKRIIVGIRGDKADKIDSIVDFGAMVYSNVEALVKSLRFEDVQYLPFTIDERKSRNGYDIGVISIDVPFTAKTNLFIAKIRSLINSSYPECYVRSSTNCRTQIDTTKKHTPSIVKGFASFASYTRHADDVLKVTARSAVFANNDLLKLEEKDVNDLNRYILSNTKLNLINDDGVIHTNKDGKVSINKTMDYYQTIKGRLCGMIFEIQDVKDHKFLVSRIQYYVRIRTRKTFETIVPIGVKIVTSKLDPVWIDNLTDAFVWTDAENKVGFLGNKDIVGTEPNVQNMMDDINQIHVNVLDDCADLEHVTKN